MEVDAKRKQPDAAASDGQQLLLTTSTSVGATVVHSRFLTPTMARSVGSKA